MIRYALACRQGHAFESWFQSSDACDEQAVRGLITCPACGSTDVEKAPMAPNLPRSSKQAPACETLENEAGPPAPPTPPSPGAKAPVAIMSAQEHDLRTKLRELREQLTKSSEHVGSRFPEEARKMHYGEIEHRSIYGEASTAEARALIDEGVEFHPLPVLPDDHN